MTVVIALGSMLCGILLVTMYAAGLGVALGWIMMDWDPPGE